MTLQRLIILCLIAVGLSACAPDMYVPDQATRAYPHALHEANSIDVQVFRDDTKLTIVNSTPQSFADFDVWVNQRYVKRVESLGAGETIALSLWDFVDQWGERFNAGGFFRTVEPTPVRMVEIQPAPDEPMIGLVAIRAEDVERDRN